jgi:hypothetical protein
MNGLWKENVGGWNHKDTRRKKQTRNNIFRDKGRALLKVYDAKTKMVTEKCDHNIYRRENEQVIVYKPRAMKPLVQVTNAYKALIEYISGYKEVFYEMKHTIGEEVIVRTYSRMDSITKMKYVTIYYDENEKFYWRKTMYDVKTRLPLEKVLKLDRTQSRSLKMISQNKLSLEVKLDWEKEKKYRETEHISEFYTYDIKEYLYGKLLPDWKRYTLYNDGKRRKIGQEIANGTDRAIIRDWISKGDWDKVISTHAYSKSISWFVH